MYQAPYKTGKDSNASKSNKDMLMSMFIFAGTALKNKQKRQLQCRFSAQGFRFGGEIQNQPNRTIYRIHPVHQYIFLTGGNNCQHPVRRSTACFCCVILYFCRLKNRKQMNISECVR